MQETIKIDVNVADNGTTDKANKNAEQLRATLKGAAEAAASVRIPVATAAARQGVAASQPKSAAYMAASGPSGQASDTNLSRGIGGQTGASGRDFAAQAQGLGGLVHVYATFAANLFAVSAAFNALSKAADTSNIIKGLDQLGAVSGTSLIGLAKSMRTAADGAISLREAMTSTALATAGGMTSDMILRMTEVAKKASQALGRDMSDSMDRLTKGIVKTQPELLDELGIMTRVIPAQQEYARKLGVSAEALTDFQKKQAFANAVIEEGERKFSKIDIDANPYSKLSASLGNLAQTGLELVNNVLGPIAKALAESPTGLAIAMAGIAGVLLKQAIPALGQFRQGLQQAANTKLEKLGNLAIRTSGGESGTYDSKIIDREEEAFKKRTGYATASAEKKKKLDIEIGDIHGRVIAESEARSARYLSHENNIQTQVTRGAKDAALARARVNVSETASVYGTVAGFKELGYQADLLKQKGSITIGGNIAQTVPAVGALGRAFFYAAGTVSILTSAMATLMAVVAPYIEIAIAIGVGTSLVVDHYKKADKEATKLSESTDALGESVKTAGKTLDLINNKPFLEQISAESIQARANAVNGLAGSLLTSSKAFESWNKAAGMADRVSDVRFFNTLWMAMQATVGNTDSFKNAETGMSHMAHNLVSQVIPSVVEAYKLLQGTVGEGAIKKSIQDIYGIKFEDAVDLEAKLRLIPDTVLSKAPQMQKAFQDVSDKVNNLASTATSAVAALKEMDKSFETLMGTLTTNDPMGKLGESTLKAAQKMGQAFEDPTNKLAVYKELVTSTSHMSLISPDTVRGLIAAKTQLEETGKRVDALKEKLTKQREEEEKAKTGLEDKKKGPVQSLARAVGINPDDHFTVSERAALKSASERVKATNAEISAINIRQVNNNLYLKAQDDLFKSGAKAINDSLQNGLAKSALELSQSIVSNANSTEAGIRRQTEIQNELIGVEIQNVTATLRLAEQNQELSRVIEESNIQAKKTENDNKKAKNEISTKEYTDTAMQLSSRQQIIDKSRLPEFQGTANITKTLNDPLSSSTDRQAAGNNLSLAAAKTNADQTTRNLKNKQLTNELVAQDKIYALQADRANKILDIESKLLSIRKAQTDSISSRAQYQTKEMVLAKEKLEIEQLELGYQKESNTIQGQINSALNRQSKTQKGSKDWKAEQAEIERLGLDRGSARLKLDYEIQAVNVRTVDLLRAARVSEFSYLSDRALAESSYASASLATAKSINGENLVAFNSLQETLDLQNLQVNTTKALYAENQKVVDSEKELASIKNSRGGSTDPKRAELLNTTIIQAQQKIADIEKKGAEGAANIRLKSGYEYLTIMNNIAKKDRENALAEAEGKSKIATLKLEGEAIQIQHKIAMNAISEETAARLTFNNTISKIEEENRLQVAKDAVEEENIKSAQKLRNSGIAIQEVALAKATSAARIALEIETQAKIKFAKESGLTGSALANVISRFESDNTQDQDKLSKQLIEDKLEIKTAADKASEAENKGFESRKQANRDDVKNRTASAVALQLQQIEQARLNRLLEEQNHLISVAGYEAKSLAGAFGDVGTAMGEMLKAIAESEANQIKMLEERTQAEKKLSEAKAGTNEEIAAKKKLQQIDKIIALEKLSSQAKIFAESKKMFDKENVFYKTLNGLERKNNLEGSYNAIKSSAIKMGLLNEEQAAAAEAGLKSLAMQASNVLSSIGINIPGIYASFMAALGPFGPPAAAAAIGLFLGAGAGQGGAYTPPTYDDFKTSQGNKTGVGGVAGDSSAINEGLKNTLDDLLDVASPQLQLTSMMVSALKGIQYNTAMMLNGADSSLVSRDMSLQSSSGGTSQYGGMATGAVLGATGLAAAGVGAATGALISGVAGLAGGLAGLGGTTAALGVSLAGYTAAAAAGAGSLATSFATLGSVVPGLGTAIGLFAGAIIGSIPAVSDFLFGTTTAIQSVSGFGVAIKDQTLATASSAIEMQRYDDVLTKTSRDRGAFEQFGNFLTGGDTSNEESESTQRIYSNLQTPAEKAFTKQIQDTYAGIGKTLTIASSVLNVDSSNLASFRTTLDQIDLSSGTAEEKTKRLNGAIAANADEFARKLLPTIDQFTHSGDTAFQAYAKLASAQEQVGQITDALGIKSIKYSDIINKQGDYAAEMMRQSISNAEAGSGLGKIIDNFSGSAGDMTTLFVRLKDVRTSFTALGYSGELVNDQLLKGAGGIDNLANALSTYEEKYLTAADRNTIATAKLGEAWKPLTTQLTAAGQTIPKTKGDFKALVESLEKGGKGSSELLGKVLLLADGFDQAATAAQTSLEQTLDQIQKMYEIQGRGDMVKAISRAKELKALDATLRPMQQYLYALEDEAALKGKLQTSYDKLKTSLTGTISSLKNSITSLNQYKVSSQFGAGSTLTAQQQYSAAKANFLNISQIASQKLTSSATEQQIADRDKALGQLQGAAEEFKNQSRSQFASSAGYTNDSKLIENTVDTTLLELNNQKTDAEKLLLQTTASTNYLSNVATNTQTTADLLAEFLSNQSDFIAGTLNTDSKKPANLSSTITNTLAAGAVNTSGISTKIDARGFALPGYADGGVASGVSIVGEKGPELVDFQNPGRVYTASQTNMLGDNTGLINELKALRDEVAKLRDDQREQTGQIIISNYDANKKNAEVVASTTESVAKMQEWKERSKVVIS